jgi:hypothetical protein
MNSLSHNDTMRIFPSQSPVPYFNLDIHRITDNWGLTTVILLNLIFYLFSLGLSVTIAQILANQAFLMTRLCSAFYVIHQK